MGQIVNVRSAQAEQAEAEGSEGLAFRVVEFTLPASYTNPGGTPGVAGVLGFKAGTIEGMLALNHLGYIWEYNITTDAIKVYQQPAAAAAGASPEVPNATNLSGAGTVRALVLVKTQGV